MGEKLAELERLWLARLAMEWHAVNQSRLKGAMKAPVFRIGEGTQTLGTFQAGTRTLSISRDHILASTWAEVRETLIHEMAHQVVSEYWNKEGVAPHGDEFKRACELLGVEGEPPCSVEEERVMARVEKLLSLAQSENIHEAESAMNLANTLLLKHNLQGRPRTSAYVRKNLGACRKRIPMVWKMIGGLLSEFFFVECIWVNVFVASEGSESRQLEVLGTPSNVAMAGYVHDFLHQSVLNIAKARQKKGKPAGRTFQCGVILGFKETLTKHQEDNQREGLVWTGDPGLTDFFKHQHPRTSSLRGRGIQRDDHLEAGKREGNRLILRRPIARTKKGDPALLQK